MAARSRPSPMSAALAACDTTNSPRPATRAATSRPAPAAATPSETRAFRAPPASSAAPVPASSASTSSGQRQAGEIDHQAGGVELELARIEPDHRHAQTRRYALREVRGGSHQRVEEQAVAHREPELEGPLALDESLVALAQRVGEHPPERGGVRQRGDHGNDERPYRQRVGDRSARDAVDDALGECVAHVGVVQRGGRARAELAAVDERGLRVPGDGGSGEQQSGGHHEGDGGATPPAVRHGQIVTVELDGRRLARLLAATSSSSRRPARPSSMRSTQALRSSGSYLWRLAGRPLRCAGSRGPGSTPSARSSRSSSILRAGQLRQRGFDRQHLTVTRAAA